MNEFDIKIRKIGEIKCQKDFDNLSIEQKEYVCFVTGYSTEYLVFGVFNVEMAKKWNDYHTRNEMALINSISKKY